jgi:uncharacterized membrane protein YhaH (DUF805 family)
MATIAAPQRRLPSERRFFTGIAAVMVVATFLGFAPTYYLSGLTGAPPLSPLVHVHGVVFSAWMLLFLGQTALIAVRRPAIHRTAGAAGAVLAAFMVVLGIATAIASARSGHGPPGRDPAIFLFFPLTIISLFAIFTAFAIARRRRADQHKRLMLLGTICLLVTPLARLGPRLGMPWPPPICGMILSDLLLLALVVFDLRKNGRLHPVTLWGGGALLLSEPLRVLIANSEAWHIFARWLIG